MYNKILQKIRNYILYKIYFKKAIKIINRGDKNE